MSKRFLLVFLFSFCAAAESHLDVQVSNSQGHPVAGLQLTVKQQPSTTATTDNAGKGSIAFTSSGTVLDLVIVNNPYLRFSQPWTGSVPVPPNSYQVVVITKGQRKMLEDRPVLAGMAARANWLLASKELENSGTLARDEAIGRVAGEFGFDAKDLSRSIETVLGSSTDPYDLGQLALLHGEYRKAAQQFNQVLMIVNLNQIVSPNQNDSNSREKGFSAAFFLGQSLFAIGEFPNAAAAYDDALKYRPDDPAILNSEGLSWSKAGQLEKAQSYFLKSIHVMGIAGGSTMIDMDTLKKNLTSTYLQIGDAQAARGDKATAADYYQKGLLIQVEQFGSYSAQVMKTQSKVANLGQAKVEQ